jgi:L-lactate permease
MNLWKKAKRMPRLGLILLAFVALGMPDGLLGWGTLVLISVAVLVMLGSQAFEWINP